MKAKPEPPRSTTELLERVGALPGDDRIALGDVTDEVGGRAYGLLIFLLSLPETIPMVGLSALLATPILVMGVLMVVRGSEPPVPQWVRRRSVPAHTLRGAIRRTRKVVAWLDRTSRQRWPRLAGAARLQGAVCVTMSVVLAVPIPGLNFLAAVAVALVGVGILQRDGAAVAVALGFAAVAGAGFLGVLAGALAIISR